MTGNIWSTGVREGHSRARTIKPQLICSRKLLLPPSGAWVGGDITRKWVWKKAVLGVEEPGP